MSLLSEVLISQHLWLIGLVKLLGSCIAIACVALLGKRLLDWGA